jgi:hypothetical protein
MTVLLLIEQVAVFLLVSLVLIGVVFGGRQ